MESAVCAVFLCGYGLGVRGYGVGEVLSANGSLYYHPLTIAPNS